VICRAVLHCRPGSGTPGPINVVVAGGAGPSSAGGGHLQRPSPSRSDTELSRYVLLGGAWYMMPSWSHVTVISSHATSNFISLTVIDFHWHCKETQHVTWMFTFSCGSSELFVKPTSAEGAHCTIITVVCVCNSQFYCRFTARTHLLMMVFICLLQFWWWCGSEATDKIGAVRQVSKMVWLDVRLCYFVV